MHFLITGSGGQLGREWVKVLSSLETDEFTACSSSDLDITRKDELEKMIHKLKPDVIINCAAYTKVDQAEEEADKAFAVNADAVEKLGALCAKQGIKLVHYSTDYVFQGSKADAQKFPDGYPEDIRTHPLNTYGRSKEKGEKALIDSGCDYLLFRVSWLCGSEGTNFVKTMLRLASEKDTLNVVDDQWGCPAFTKNVVRNSYQLIKYEKSGIFHLSSSGRTNWYEFAREVFRQSEMEVELKAVAGSEFPTKAKRPAFSLLSTRKIANIPGVEIQNWKAGLSELLDELN